MTRRSFSSEATAADTERYVEEVDVCIVGGGPSGLSAAIRLTQMAAEKGKELRVVVVEKGGEVGKTRENLPSGDTSTF